MNIFSSLEEVMDRSKDVESFDLMFPRVVESIIPLAYTGVSARNFHSWKENELVDLVLEKGDQERKNIKLNLYEYIWVKMIQTMRSFGLSYDTIKFIKDSLFATVSDTVIALKDETMEILRVEHGNTEEQLLEVSNAIDVFVTLINLGFDENSKYSIERTVIFQMITITFLRQLDSSILIINNDGDFKIDFTVNNKLENVRNLSLPSLSKPHLSIPLLKYVEDFLGDPKSEKYSEGFGLINPKEKKVLDAIRKKDFIEIHIKQDKENEIIIDVIKDGSITDEKASQIRKILGLGNYEEITLKYRNDKNLYFRNKTRTS